MFLWYARRQLVGGADVRDHDAGGLDQPHWGPDAHLDAVWKRAKRCGAGVGRSICAQPWPLRSVVTKASDADYVTSLGRGHPADLTSWVVIPGAGS